MYSLKTKWNDYTGIREWVKNKQKAVPHSKTKNSSPPTPTPQIGRNSNDSFEVSSTGCDRNNKLIGTITDSL